MKKDLHPENYRFVVFQDNSCDYSFLTKSTIETLTFSGNALFIRLYN